MPAWEIYMYNWLVIMVDGCAANGFCIFPSDYTKSFSATFDTAEALKVLKSKKEMRFPL